VHTHGGVCSYLDHLQKDSQETGHRGSFQGGDLGDWGMRRGDCPPTLYPLVSLKIDILLTEKKKKKKKKVKSTGLE
jgi:hypothetical protein